MRNTHDPKRARPLGELQLQYVKRNSVILLYHFIELGKELSVGICERKSSGDICALSELLAFAGLSFTPRCILIATTICARLMLSWNDVSYI